MKKLYCVICSKYKKFENPKILYLPEKKILVLCIICRKCKNENEILFKEDESSEMLKLLGLIEKNMKEEYKSKI